MDRNIRTEQDEREAVDRAARQLTRHFGYPVSGGKRPPGWAEEAVEGVLRAYLRRIASAYAGTLPKETLT